jgi:hypothetical protein
MADIKEISKFIDAEGDLQPCIFPGCNIRCNIRWNYGEMILTACCKTHLSRQVIRDLKHEMEQDGLL